MKKVGIITLNGYFNYGNRLQNYALQELIQSNDFEVETIIVDRKKPNNKNISFLKRLIKRSISVGKVVSVNKRIDTIRTEKFKKFSNKYIKETDYQISEVNIPVEKIGKFDFFVTGSDQVWNPSMNASSSIFFLAFVPKHKRISYAASFGISKLPNEVISDYKKWLSDIPNLSVREEAGARIIKDLTRREAEVVLDPTLMLTKEKWLSIAEKSYNRPNNKYLLTYFLGEVSQEREAEIKSIAQKKNLEIVRLANIEDKKAYTADPSEFIDYINSAEMFLTDSFHGCVFSILLEKPFAVFERDGSKNSMSSRIDTLLGTFNLPDRKWENISSIDDIYNVDYSHVPPILDIERKKSIGFLEKALK